MFGLDFVTDTSIEDVVDALAADRDESGGGWRCVVTPNVDHLVRYRKHPTELATAQSAFIVLPDGMPIVWASRLLGAPISARMTGADLFAALWPRLADQASPTVVVASSEIVASRLRAGHPEVRCIVPPMFDVGDDAAVAAVLDEIDARIEEIRARFLVVGVSMPKHHLIAHRLEERWSDGDRAAPIVLLLGASPDFALGLTARAPSWMQRYGLEWLHRLALDPRRMAKRYLVDDLAFLSLVAGEWRARRRGRRL